VSGAGWTNNKGLGYVVGNLGSGHFGLVTANSSSNITYLASSQDGLTVFNPGDAFEIRKVLQAIDKSGLSTGDLLSGDNPSPRWLNQVLEPVCQWGNTLNGANGLIVTKFPTILEGVHYLNNTVKPGYSPLVYPHPLVSSQPNRNRPDPPSNFHVVTGGGQ